MEGVILELRSEDNQRSLRVLEGLESLRSLVLSGDKIHILVGDAEEAERRIRELLRGEGIGILDLSPVRPSLEDAFVAIVKGRET
jgi:hypothetical protein